MRKDLSGQAQGADQSALAGINRAIRGLVQPATTDQPAVAVEARTKAKHVGKPRFTWKRVMLYVILFVLLIYAFFPTFWLLSTSIKPQLEAFQNPPTWWPHNPTLFSYQILRAARTSG